MDTQSSAGMPQIKSTQDIFDAAARFERRDDYGSLILDRLGRIISCGIPAERIFGASRVRLIGRLMSDFAAGLFPNGSSPSYNARYLVHLCADGQWRKYEARNDDGQPIAVELKLMRLSAPSGSDREMFLLNVRRPEPDDTGH